jgi:MFS transporter, DHA1 family, multidrug resistance protein
MTWARVVPAEAWRRNQYAVLIAVFVSFLGFSFVLPFLPLYIGQLGVDDLGQIALLSGLAFALAPLFSGLLAPVWGALADRHGVKIMVQRALFSFAILNFLMSLVWSPYQLLALRAGIGLFGGFGPMTASLVTRGAPQKEIGSAIGKLQATQILATAIGPMLGGLVADQFGIRASFIVTAVLCFISFVLITILYREDRGGEKRERPEHLPIRQLFTLAGFTPILAVIFLSQFVDRGLGPIIPLFVGALDPTVPVASTAGLVFSIGLFVSAAAASQAGRLIRQHDPRHLLLLSLIIGFAAILPLVLVDQIWQLMVTRVFFGLATGTTMTVAYSVAARVVPQHVRSTAFGFLGSASSMATALGPITAGALAGFSLRAVFAVDAVIYLVAFGLALSAFHSLKSAPDKSD